MKPGRDADGVAQTETDHFGNCPVRGALVSAEIRFLLAQEGWVHEHTDYGRVGDELMQDFQILWPQPREHESNAGGIPAPEDQSAVVYLSNFAPWKAPELFQ